MASWDPEGAFVLLWGGQNSPTAPWLASGSTSSDTWGLTAVEPFPPVWEQTRGFGEGILAPLVLKPIAREQFPIVTDEDRPANAVESV